MNKTVYFFDANGVCQSCRTFDPDLIGLLFPLTGAAHYVVSELSVPLARARCVDGELKEVEPTVTLEQQWQAVRTQREFKLMACDWTQLPDVPIATKEAWTSYRQGLRDITIQANPFDIIWPIAP